VGEDGGLPDSTSLTSGSIGWSIWRLAAPMVIGQILAVALNLVDLFWVGCIEAEEDTAVAAVGVAGQAMFVVLTAVSGAATGAGAIVARHVGRGERARAGHAAAQSMILALVGSAVLAALGLLFSDAVFVLLKTPPAVVPQAAVYFRVMMLGAVMMFFLLLTSSILQAAGDAKTPLLAACVAMGVNAALDPFLIFGIWVFPRLGVAGAAWATIASRAVGLAMLAYVMAKRKHGPFTIRRSDFVPHGGEMWRVIKVGFPSSVEMGLRTWGGIILYRIVNPFGGDVMAAYTVGRRLTTMALIPGFGLGRASGALVGQNLGAGKPARSERSAWTVVAVYVAFMAVLGAVYFVFAPALVGVFVRSTTAAREGTRLLRIVSCGYIFQAVGLILARSLHGAGDTVGPMAITGMALFGVQLPLAWLLSRGLGPRSLGPTGIWIGIVGVAVVGAALTTLRFKLGRWKTKKV
jgi:putative MATE family efflux protein